ncbi:MAG: nucleotidyltransferase domain-containing protein [Candidatus Nanoarchaeia archaeon]
MIEKLFTSKNRVKILGYLFFNKSESHIREISKELKISPSAVKGEIDNLNKIGIVRKQENKIILDKECNIVPELKSILIKTDFIVDPIKKSVNKIHKIEFAFIFGSFANGKFKNESDVDLLIIGEIKSFDFYKQINPVEKEINREINPVVWTKESLIKEKNSGFIKEIFSKKILMIKGDENEIRKIVR